MFTGLIAALGTVVARTEQEGGGARLLISAPSSLVAELGEGDSICCSGACLTALNVTPDHPTAPGFEADVSPETLRLTTLANAAPGFPLNLEPAMAANGRFGGHIVTGHVDATGELLALEPTGEYVTLTFSAPAELAPLIARKGSICVDGVSLTVNEADAASFKVMLIPRTLSSTTLGRLRPGNKVNLEADLAARYLMRFHEIYQTPAAFTTHV